ncbi:MAG: hypothetical protein EOP06_15035 [Proteobacteria bacterium]|nr:MAG: hypothetical protein EOP06_15035 [Pseudomonadota bacterium]
MTIEYVLLLIAVFFIGLKFFITGPQDAFKTSGPRLAVRVEKQLLTGQGFKIQGKKTIWSPEP